MQVTALGTSTLPYFLIWTSAALAGALGRGVLSLLYTVGSGELEKLM